LRNWRAGLLQLNKINAEVLPARFGHPNAPEKILPLQKKKAVEIDLLIKNAGFGQYGEFHSIEKQRLLDMVQVGIATRLST